jgi:PAS domain S-box-containing protein
MRTMRFFALSSPRLTAVGLLAVLAAGVLFAWWTAARADRALRAELLQQTRLVARAVSIDRVRALTGTAADLGSPDYTQLKDQLAAVRSANPRCRFVYLTGRKTDGTVFFFLDSEPAGSEDYSPPGQVYEEVSADYRRVFDTGAETVEGPVPDRWGTWVSALVPLTDAATGTVVAVLGLDFDARTWKRDVAADAALPVGLMLVLLIGAAAAFVSTRRADLSPKPIMRRLLPPLAAMMILLMAGAGGLLWRQHRRQLTEAIATSISKVNGDLRVALNQQAVRMAAVARSIAADANVRSALRAGDAGRLLAASQPVFEALHREHGLTHFYFLDRNRGCLLLIHVPGSSCGGRNERFTALEAERTGKTASGIELGTLGTFTMRVVQPVFADGALAGYVELSEEVTDAVRLLPIPPATQLAVVIRKASLNERTRQAGIFTAGACRSCHTREADWDRMTSSVVIYASQGRLPDAIVPWADHFAADHFHGEPDREAAFDGKDWQASATPLLDASGAEIGHLLVMRDISTEKAAFARLIGLAGTVGAALLALLLSFLYVLLRRTDAGIRAQQAALRESDQRHRSLFDQANEGLLVMSLDGQLSEYNRAFAEMHGYRVDELQGMDIGELDVLEERALENRAAILRRIRAGETVRFEVEHFHKDGHVFPLAVTTSTITLGHQPFYLAFHQDITERKRAEEALARASQLNDLILNSSVEGIIGLDSASQHTFVNAAAVAMLGYDAEELLGRPSHSVWHHTKPDGSPYPREECPIYAAFRDGAVHRVSTEVFWRKDGSSFPVEYASTPIHAEGRLVGAVVTFSDISERIRAEADLRASRQELRDLASHLQSVREQERTDVAREIHDELGQALTALKMDVHWLGLRVGAESVLLEKTRTMSKTIDTTVQAVRRISSQLRPKLLDNLGLSAALEWQAREFEQRSGVECDINSEPDDIILAPAISTALFRIFQETLTNIARHAGASSVDVLLKMDPGKVAMTVIDDGMGITSEQASDARSLGIVGMRERMYSLGGTFEISGRAGLGTTVHVTVPV